jgi:hypothetical protein
LGLETDLDPSTPSSMTMDSRAMPRTVGQERDWVATEVPGQSNAEGSHDEISTNEEVIEAYLGRPADLEGAT